MDIVQTTRQLDDRIGARVTARTLAQLRRREEAAPGLVQSLLVYFRDDFEPGALHFLRHTGRSQTNREIRCRLVRENADRMQAPVRHFLYKDNGAEVAPFFRGCPDFLFEPQRHLHLFPALNALAMPATSELAKKVATLPNVVAVQRNLRLSSLTGFQLRPLSRAVALASEKGEWDHVDGYTWGWHCLGLKAIHQAGLNGKVNDQDRIIYGMADTGGCEDHPDLVFDVKDFLVVEGSGRGVPAHAFDRQDAHGTHCAGTVIGGNRSGTQIGGAPEANLKLAAVLDGQHGHLAALYRALDWFADQFRSVSVVNLSLGVERVPAADRVLLDAVFARLDLHGMVCVGAIGNARGVSMYPARLNSVLGCGAFGPDGEVWESSGDAPDFILPGVEVYSSIPPSPRSGHRLWERREGTSCAAAHLTSLVGLLWQACPPASSELIRQALRETASASDHPGLRTGFGIPRFWKAVQWLEEKFKRGAGVNQ
jgi:hypothetical protein